MNRREIFSDCDPKQRLRAGSFSRRKSPPAERSGAPDSYTQPGEIMAGSGPAWERDFPADLDSETWTQFFSLSAAPEIRRRSMSYARLERNPLARLWERVSARLAGGRSSAPSPANGEAWSAVVRRRRLCLAALVIVQTLIASWSLTKTFPYPSLDAIEIAIVAIFAVLFSWISFGFWSSLFGFWIEWKGQSRFSIDASTVVFPDELHSRTAILMPICNEDPERVFSGLEATYRSLADSGALTHFDFFVVSDTGDAERQVEEELAWAQLCRAVQGFGKIFYRHRRNNIKRKSGNIADFLRRWGGNYDYVTVFDADSIMSGTALVRLAAILDANPRAGIVQTATTSINRESLYARVQQFANRLYGPMLTAGLRFWQLGESYYWGHNAMIRVEPFMRHCGLGRLPGKPPLGGEILSHDFVEAALMGRAGWEVWIVDDSSGSYEENPPSLLDELKRDRRWCQGNLQHLKLILTDGLRGGHTAIFMMGIMAYGSALLWFLFLLLSTVAVIAWSVLPPVYFPPQPNLFPVWPQWRPEWAIGLVSTTAILLFFPKFLALLLAWKKGETRLYGGFIALCSSILLEILASSLLAPVRMWFHSKFVVLTLMGRQIKWGTQQRADSQTPWLEALRAHGFATGFAAVWLTLVVYVNAAFLWWLLPVAVPLIAAIPVSVLSSRVSLGKMLRRWRLLVIPEEGDPPQVVRYLQSALHWRQFCRSPWPGFERVMHDGFANAVHVGLLRGKTHRSARGRARAEELRIQLLNSGCESLTASDKRHLLRDSRVLSRLYRELACCDIHA